jgi:hypothetical protein
MIIKHAKRINGLALFADGDHKAHDKIYKLRGIKYEKPTKYTIQIDVDNHILDPYGTYMNHSFSPTCIIKEGWILALRNLDAGEELTFDYNVNETCCAFQFVDADTQKKVVGNKFIN